MLVPARGAGKNAHWFEQCDEITKKVSEGVNGFLFQELLWASDHCDLEVAELFRQGAAMLGELERSGVGEPMYVDLVKSIVTLQASCVRSNAALVKQLKEDCNATELLRITREDAVMGRMTGPVPLESIDTAQALLNPRFGVEKEKEDGGIKVRAVDHLSWSPGTQGDADMPSRPCKRARKEASVN